MIVKRNSDMDRNSEKGSRKRTAVMDRRSAEERRKTHNLHFFLDGGTEQRKWKERRSSVERRTDWIKVSEWNSVYEGAIGFSNSMK